MLQEMSKYRWIALSGVVLLILMGVMGYWMYRQRQAAQERQWAEEQEARGELLARVKSAWAMQGIAHLCLEGLKAKQENRLYAARIFFLEAAQREQGAFFGFARQKSPPASSRKLKDTPHRTAVGGQGIP